MIQDAHNLYDIQASRIRWKTVYQLIVTSPVEQVYAKHKS